MPLPARITELQDHAVGALVRSVKGTSNGMPAVRWLSVRQLRRTAADVVQASIFARFADKREAMASSPREFYRLPPVAGGRDVWVDYVSDTGDGFDATFATACCLAGVPGLTVGSGPDSAEPQPFPGRPAQADLLVFGGDEVYPVASAPAYEERLNEVLRSAARLAEMRPSPPVVALPGNHDWYDGLAAFRRNFCESWVLRGHERSAGFAATDLPGPAARDDVGGWGAFQSRSYFAVQLSPQWWLWGLDSQLNAPIDAEQLAYFHEARRLLGDADIILCTASPSWLEASGERVYAALADTPFYTLLWFVDRVLGADRGRVRMMLTGDEHHYARYSPEAPAAAPPAPVPPAPGGPAEPAFTAPGAAASLVGDTPPNDTPFAPELVTCGGGGAFLASTHHLPDALTPAWQPWPTGSGSTGKYRLSACYPSRERSQNLIAFPRFLAAGWRNGWSLPLALGAVDFVLAAAILLARPVLFWATAVAVVLFLGLYAASGAKELRPRWRKRTAIAALLSAHIAAHVGAALLVAYLVTRLGLADTPVLGFPVAFVLSAVFGTTVFVTYLRVADWWGSHTLEAFSGLRMTGYKSHLRLRVADDRIEVFVLGMDEVPATRHVRTPGTRLPHPYLVESFSVPANSGLDRPGP